MDTDHVNDGRRAGRESELQLMLMGFSFECAVSLYTKA
jgi:hypothetical protein